jgi:hypothetical protein
MFQINIFIILIILLISSLTNSISDEVIETPACDHNAGTKYKKYFDGMNKIYPGAKAEGTCLPVHESCGWPKYSHIGVYNNIHI